MHAGSTDGADAAPTSVDLRDEFEAVGVEEVLDELDRELVGLEAGQEAHPRDRGAAAGRARPQDASASRTSRRPCT